MKNSKFNSLYQEAYNRYTNGNGFLVGDVVKLKSGYENVESYKSLGENVKQRMKEMLKTGNNIRVGKLHSNSVGSRYSAEGANSAPASMADCYEEYSPGAVRNLITIPVECLEEVDTGANLAPVPEGQKDMEDRVTGPDEFGKHGWHKGKAVNDQNKLGAKQNWVEKGNYELATKNTKLAHSNKYNDILPTKVKGMIKAKNINESQTLLENLYLNILNEDVGTMGGGDAGAQQDANANMEETENIKEKDDIYGFEKMALAGAKPGMSQKEVLSLAFTNIEKWAMATRKADASKAEIIAGNLLYYMNDGDGASDVVTYYSHMFPKTAANEEDEGNKFTGDLAHTKKGDKFEIGGKKVTNTTGTIAEEICPICKRDVCQCNEMEMVGNDMEAPCPKCHTNPCTCLEEESMFDESDLKHHIKDECWNMEEDRLVDECWAEDGSVKEECWRMQEDAMPSNDSVAMDNNAKDPEQTSGL